MPEVALPEGTIAYRDSGTGRPLVFVHGILANGRLWERVVPLLDRRFRCIVPDLPLGSHRWPMPTAYLTPPGVADLLIRFIDALGLDQVVLVGNDTGGALCQLVVASQPERVAALVLTPCDAYENFPPRMLFAVLKLAARVPGGIRLLAETMRFRLAWRMPVSLAGLAKSRFDRDLVDAWFAPAREDAGVRRDAARVIRGVDKRYTLSAVDGLRRFDRPALILWPRHAPHFPFEHAERLAKDLPNSTLVEIADSYAFVSLDQPQATAAAIAAFLD